MKFAFIIYDGMTLLDFAGTYDPITRLKSMGFVDDFTYDVCATQNTVRTFEGLVIKADKVNYALNTYDYIFIPGGNSIAGLLKDTVFLDWIRNISTNTIITAVCGGTLLLGAAGFLKDKEATTHPGLMQYLKNYTTKATQARVVDAGNVITAGGVTAAIDLGLYLCQKITTTEVRQKIQKQMDYQIQYY